MILVDTSAWVEYDRATGTPTDQHLTALITESADLAVTEPVLMEVLAGAKSDHAARQLRRLLTSFYWIPAEASTDFEAAAATYRKCRSAGITPRGLTDCMIASIAMRTGSRLLAADADFARMAGVIPLRIEGAG
jgi:hypothetical protein